MHYKDIFLGLLSREGDLNSRQTPSDSSTSVPIPGPGVASRPPLSSPEQWAKRPEYRPSQQPPELASAPLMVACRVGRLHWRAAPLQRAGAFDWIHMLDSEWQDW